jgi:DNA-binding IclR family transcriptional regulator
MERPFHIAEMSQTRTGTQSIDRAAELLVRVVESDDAPSVGELAEASGLPKSTTSRLVSALERQGLLQRDTDRAALVPGPVLLRYARKERTAPDLIELAANALDRLAEATGETINLGVATTGAVEQLDQRDSRHYLGSTNWVGKRVPLHASAIGKVFMAFGDFPVPAGPLERLAPRTLTRPEELAADLVVTRARGYASAVDELEPGLWAIAAPVFDAGGTVIAALSVSGPTVRFRPRLLDDLGKELCRETSALSTQLGHDDITKGAA